MSRKTILIIVLAIVIIGLVATAIALKPPEKKRLIIATAGTAGSLYPMGVAMAEVINKYLPEFMASAEASAASVENIRLLHEGKVDWGISHAETAYMAYHGIGDYEGKPHSELRSLFGTVLGYFYIIVNKEAGITSIDDLKGKRLGVDRPGSAGELGARRILAYYNLTYDDMAKVIYGGAPDLVQALMDGKVDAIIFSHPPKSAPVIELLTKMKGKVDMVSITDPGFYKKYPFYEMAEIPPGTFEGIDHTVYLPAFRVLMLTTTRMSADDVYKLLKVIWEHRDEWKSVHAAVEKYVTLEKALWGVNIPLHPGAVKYYKELGFKIPEELIPSEMKG